MSPLLALKVPEKLRNSLKDETFRVYFNAKQEEIEVFLTGVVGDEYTQSDAASIAGMLSANRQRPVHLRVNSFGGLAFDGLAIHNAMEQHDGPTRATIEGVAASAASLAAIGADKVSIHENATYHIHEGLAFGFGHIADLQETINWLQAFNEAAIATYAAKTGKSISEMGLALLGKNGDGTIYSADAAKAAGFVDEVIPLKKKSASASDKQRLQSMLNYRISAHNRRTVDLILTGSIGAR